MQRTPEWMQQKADEWIELNPYAWMLIKDKAGEYARAGKRFSIRHIAQFVRFEMHTNGKIDGFKMNNSITPCLARRLVQEVPAVAGYIETRKSKVDTCSR